MTYCYGMYDYTVYGYRQAVIELVSSGAISGEHGAWLLAQLPGAVRYSDVAVADDTALEEDQPVRTYDAGPGLP